MFILHFFPFMANFAQQNLFNRVGKIIFTPFINFLLKRNVFRINVFFRIFYGIDFLALGRRSL